MNVQKIANSAMDIAAATVQKAPKKVAVASNAISDVSNKGLDALASYNSGMVKNNKTLAHQQEIIATSFNKIIEGFAKDGYKFVPQQNIVLNNGKTYAIFPLTASKESKLAIFKLVLPNKVVTNVELNPAYIRELRKLCGRELTNIDVLKSPSFKTVVTARLSADAKKALDELSSSNPEKYQLVNSVLANTYIFEKTKQGVSEDYINRIVSKLLETDDILLKNNVNNKIPIEIYDDLVLFPDKSHAQYRHGKKPIVLPDGTYELDAFNNPKYARVPDKRAIILSERCNSDNITINGIVQDTAESLPHEMGHAYDSNDGIKLGLEKQDFISIIDGENFERYADMPSFSKGFDVAIAADITRMMDMDEKTGKNIGETFEALLNDPDFGYYLGTQEDSKNTCLFNDVVARKELFAQMVSYVTTGKVSNKNFQNRIEELFPNCINFVSDLMKSQ